MTYRGNNQEHVIAELVEHGTTALRELRVFENLTAPAMTSWLTAMPQLELLDLRPARELHDQSPVIEGDVVTLPGRRSSTLLTVDDNAPEPWWDRIDVLTL